MLGTVQYGDVSLNYESEYHVGSQCPDRRSGKVLWNAEVVRPGSKRRSTSMVRLFHWTLPKDGQD